MLTGKKISKIYILLYCVFTTTIFTNNCYCQEIVDVYFENTVVDGNQFSGHITFSILNNSNDTLITTLEPYDINFVRINGIFAENLSSVFSPNRLIFFEDITGAYMEFLSNNTNSFLKFPRLLILEPKNLKVINIIFGDKFKYKIDTNKWSIKAEICCVYKNNLDNKILEFSDVIQKEYYNALIKNDSVSVDIQLQEEKLLGSLFLYKPGRNGFTAYDSTLSVFNMRFVSK